MTISTQLYKGQKINLGSINYEKDPEIESCWTHNRDYLHSLGLGERDYWGKGYGTDALRTLLRYAFTERNLRRLTLLVFDYNVRAMRAYEKCGFVNEGSVRGVIQREGRRWDWHYMGILKEEWERTIENEIGEGEAQRVD